MDDTLCVKFMSQLCSINKIEEQVSREHALPEAQRDTGIWDRTDCPRTSHTLQIIMCRLFVRIWKHECVVFLLLDVQFMYNVPYFLFLIFLVCLTFWYFFSLCPFRSKVLLWPVSFIFSSSFPRLALSQTGWFHVKMHTHIHTYLKTPYDTHFQIFDFYPRLQYSTLTWLGVL